MAKFLQLLAFCLAACNCRATFLSTTKWSDLTVTWFKENHMPLTMDDANTQGFVSIDTPTTPMDKTIPCANGPFLGYRYMKPNEPAVIILYGINGYVAGIQTSFPKNLIKVGNIAWYENTAMFNADTVEGNEMFTLTSYLIEPERICTTGRTLEEFNQAKSGTGLYLQNGPDPLKDNIIPPINETDIQTPWTKGRCFVSMGRHYWYDTSRDMDCANFRPVFLLYNKGELTGFGWAVLNLDSKSYRYETPPKSSFSLFFEVVPDCVNEAFDRNKGVTTMHVFMNAYSLLRFC